MVCQNQHGSNYPDKIEVINLEISLHYESIMGFGEKSFGDKRILKRKSMPKRGELQER